MKRAYKLKSGKIGPPDNRGYTVMIADSTQGLYARLAAGEWEPALREEELHIAPLGEVK